MPSDFQPASGARMLLALIIVVLTVIAVWKFIDYRTEPPAPPAMTAPL